MVSLFGRGFDSLQLHHLSKCNLLTFRKLADFLCSTSPVFSVFGDALGDAKRVLLNPIWQLLSYFLTQLQIIKKLKNALLLRFYLLFLFLLSFLPFSCFCMKLQMWVVFWFCHSIFDEVRVGIISELEKYWGQLIQLHSEWSEPRKLDTT